MNPEVKDKWIDALTSGEYEQGILYLKKGNNYCCLGVLCDLFIKEHPGTVEWESSGAANDFIFDSTSALPDQVREWSGVSEYEEADLMELNDREGKSFEDIADYIKESL